MLTLSCPSCGANVDFKSKASMYAVCSFCKSSLVRQDMDLEKIGIISELTDDFSPIQIGTTGMFDNERFEVIGRMKVGYADGFWNEWCALLNNGTIGWLAEAQGFYAFCLPYFEKAPPTKASVQIGRSVDLGAKGVFEVEDKRDVKCVLSEGELPFQAMQGRESTSVDLAGFEDEMATIEYAKSETRVFVGKYIDFDNLQFKNLRRIDGW